MSTDDSIQHPEPGQPAPTALAARLFFILQVAFVAFVAFVVIEVIEVIEVILAGILKLPATENTSSISMKGDTALTAPWTFTIVWAVLVFLAFKVRRPVARGVLALLATIYGLSITLGNSSEVFAKTPQFTGWRWTVVVTLDLVAAVLSLLCLVAALRWLSKAIAERRIANQTIVTDWLENVGPDPEF